MPDRFVANQKISVRHPDGREVDYQPGEECLDVPAGWPSPADVDQGLVSPSPTRPGKKSTKSGPAAGDSEENA